MKIIIRRDREDAGWVACRDGAFYGIQNNTVFKTMGDACIAAYSFDPTAEVWVDARQHSKLGNGIVFPKGEVDLQPVTFKTTRGGKDDQAA